MNLSKIIQHHLLQLSQDNLLRTKMLIDPSISELNFSRNDYLGLTDDPSIREAYVEGFNRYPAGSGASMVVAGYHPIHQALEQAFCESLSTDSALLFSSGYAANLSVVNLLARLKCHVLLAKESHASFFDGIKLAKANYTRFIDAADWLKKMPLAHSPRAIITEGVYSMSGYQPDLNQWIRNSQLETTAWIVDEAHAFGVIGPKGLGAVAQANLTQTEIPLRIIAFGKSMASQGAIVVGQRDWIQILLQFGRSHTYSTAMSPGLAYGLTHTLKKLLVADDRRAKLQSLVNYFQQKISMCPHQWTPSITPIQQLLLGCPQKALAYSQALKQQGIICQAMRSPTVTKPATGLRVVLNYQHTNSDIDDLFSQLKTLYSRVC